MSKYEEICQVATTARQNWIGQRDRSWGYMIAIVNGFIAHCRVPPDHITFLRSTEATGDQRAYREAEDGSRYTLLGATVLDEEDDYYHLGVCLTLSPSNILSPNWISFALCVAERDGKTMVKIGANGDPRQIDVNDPGQCEAFCESIVEKLKQCYQEPKKSGSKPIGFVVSSSGPTDETTAT